MAGKIEVCFILDESGSVCTKPNSKLTGCSSSSHYKDCEYNGKSSKSDPLYCPKFNTDTKAFVKGFVQSMDTKASAMGATTKYAVQTFSDGAQSDQGLASSATTTNTVNGLSFAGGYTWTAEGMEMCQKALMAGDADAEKVVVLVTDGRPRKSGVSDTNYFATTEKYATNIKNGKNAATGSGTVPPMQIMAIGVETVEWNLDFIDELASPGLAVKLTDGYDSLVSQVDVVVESVATGSCNLPPIAVDDYTSTDVGKIFSCSRNTLFLLAALHAWLTLLAFVLCCVDVPVTGNVLNGRLSNNLPDSDPNGDGLVVNSSPKTPPTHGTLENGIDSEGNFKYIPKSGWTGTDR